MLDRLSTRIFIRVDGRGADSRERAVGFERSMPSTTQAVCACRANIDSEILRRVRNPRIADMSDVRHATVLKRKATSD